MKNVELKMELRDLSLARTIARRLGRELATYEQTDTYYLVIGNRLKKRETRTEGGGVSVEYIRYQRADDVRPRVSEYTRFDEASFREHFGGGELPERCVVVKRREVFLIGGTSESAAGVTRVHLDVVDGLGMFLEFETVVSDEFQEPAARARVQDLREQFAPALGEAVSAGYADLIEQPGGRGRVADGEEGSDG